MATSVFAEHRKKVYKHRWRATIEVETLVGGVPVDDKKARGWLQGKFGKDRGERLREVAAERMVEQGKTADEVTEEVLEFDSLNGFKRFIPATLVPGAVDGGLYAEGRCMKAAVKEAANIAWPKERWGPSSKGTSGFWAEHVFVDEVRMPLLDADGNNLLVPSGVHQRFVHTWRGNAIQYEEFVENAIVTFTVLSDFDFSKAKVKDVFPTLWVVSETNGFGASRSQGFGRFSVIEWTDLGKGAGNVHDIIEPEDEAEMVGTAALLEQGIQEPVEATV